MAKIFVNETVGKLQSLLDSTIQSGVQMMIYIMSV